MDTEPDATGTDGAATIRVEADGPVLRVTFDRPRQHNAMTWSMYDGLLAACERADADEAIRVLVLRGAGGEAFVAGTDIAQFAEFEGGADGLAYEHRMVTLFDRLDRVGVPTVAVVEGYCVGAGLALAALCDLRVASTSARFGVPVARTLGNCLSMSAYALLVQAFGSARTLDMLLRARLLGTDEVQAAGFLTELCEPPELDERAESVVRQVAAHAPLSMWATKKAVRRLRSTCLPDGDDLVEQVYDSADFREGVRAFVAKDRPRWTGR